MTRILCMDHPEPADDMGWAHEALTRGYGPAVTRAFLGYDDAAGLAEAHLPHGLRVAPARPAPDLFRLRSGLLVASRQMREAIEAVEPARHLFWPLRVFAGAAMREGWSGLIVRRHGAAISEARSLCHVEPADPALGFARHATLIDHRAAVDRARLPDADLWWDRALSKPYLLVSERLAPAFEMLDAPPMRACRE